MIKRLMILAFACIATTATYAQKTLNSKQMIGITPIVCNELDLPGDANRSLTQKLRQISTKNGFGAISSNFILTANPVVVDKQMTPSAPAQFIVELDVSIYVVNVSEQIIVNEITTTVKGINRLENKAFIAAINRLNARTPAIRNFMEQSRTKIVSYYTTKLPKIISNAKSLAEREEYDKALAILGTVPDCVEGYEAVVDLMSQTYKTKLKIETTALIQEAKSEITQGNYDDAMDIINNVNPVSPNAKEAYAMLDKINNKIEAEKRAATAERLAALEEQKRQFDLKRIDMQKQQQNNFELSKLTAESAKEVAIAQANKDAEIAKNDAVLRTTLYKLTR
ncbi:MAG: hypothetical protein IMY73_04750 [Bacteroidetes bacterium]|nr:hypothetical protein [Bacteroidota bacterium]